jgi:SAM-dependent methyltransferase
MTCGLDLHAVSLSQARTISKDSELVVGTATDLPFREKVFDKALLTEVLEHVVDDGRTLGEIARILRDDGTLVVTVPNECFPLLWDPINWILTRLGGPPLRRGHFAGIWWGHVRLYTQLSLESKLTKKGFAVLQTKGITSFCLPMHHTILGFLIRFHHLRFLVYAVDFIDRLNRCFDARRSIINTSVGIVVKCRKTRALAPSAVPSSQLHLHDHL